MYKLNVQYMVMQQTSMHVSDVWSKTVWNPANILETYSVQKSTEGEYEFLNAKWGVLKYVNREMLR